MLDAVDTDDGDNKTVTTNNQQLINNSRHQSMADYSTRPRL